MQFHNNGQAIYLQIVDYVCEQILQQKWLPEVKVPSVRELAMQLEVNPNTVARAYDFLKQQEIIMDKRGIGYFITTGAVALVMQYRKKIFIDTELPPVFRIMRMLDLSPQDLQPLFERYKKEVNS
ncbi:GntR family transcriptional regulator [Filimonas effusa]|uniref:GntR family transcriptional regulator n=1 Tax=Filimonas effusa TaxID=2508721 RepID=A0A4Q1D4R1_9BACT|nr:GntR family transcriptional regulator [Filimonas effusa]RXK82926.1 GntR family transcriptional regulator [Filimonas effusa]